MELIPMFLREMEQEAQTTRNMLARIPDDRYGWQPHPKSMTIRQLATHIAELPTWVTMVLTTDELDFATSPYQPTEINTTADLMNCAESCLVNGRSQLVPEKEALLTKTWTLRDGETIYMASTKHEMIRTTFCQIVHHRAQLGVYLRLLDIPIPGSYGPSADEQ
ncbi:DinB family protein [Spirosoma luteum]|uniref:DinB family protein n=1 Tax=Spirosoma luteum TaxID=431553 RepID=UPI00036E3B60|nr:DinB family protein [Spirosoma luteum]